MKLFNTLILISLLASLCLNKQQQPQTNSQKLLGQQLSMKRTACLLLSRYHTKNHHKIVEEISESLPIQYQPLFINKIYAVAIQRCLPKITLQQAKKFYVQNPKFDISKLFYLIDGIDYQTISKNLQLSPNQQQLLKFIKQFDEEMEIRQQQIQDEKDDDEQQNDGIAIFGFPFKSFNSMAGYAYILVLLSIVVGGLVWGYQQLNNSKLPKNKSNKKNRSPKKD